MSSRSTSKDSTGTGTRRFDVVRHNSRAWDAAVERESVWTIPVSDEEITAARQGDWSIVLTTTKPVPAGWFPSLESARILCLASGGGQQGPVLAAAGDRIGATVIVFDNSPAQLEQDRKMAGRHQLPLKTVEGDMRDLSVFEPNSFDLIVHPCSNLFVPDVRPVWHEAARVLVPGGVLLSGFVNPVLYLFDQKKADDGDFVVRHRLPYSDLTSIGPRERQDYIDETEALEFGHTLTDQISGQISAGFAITGFYEDDWPGVPLGDYTDLYIATRALLLES